MENLLLELEDLKRRIAKQIEIDSNPITIYSERQILQQEGEQYEKSIDFNKKWFLITLTFDTKLILNKNESFQKQQLLQCLNYVSKHHYYACLEKHKSGILHSHILISCDFHDIQKELQKMKKIITKSKFLEPAINIKPVKQTQKDIINTYNYIIKDKPDHPLYKFIKISIPYIL